MSVQEVWLGEQVGRTLQEKQFVRALYVLVSVRLHRWADGLISFGTLCRSGISGVFKI